MIARLFESVQGYRNKSTLARYYAECVCRVMLHTFRCYRSVMFIVFYILTLVHVCNFGHFSHENEIFFKYTVLNLSG